MEDYFNSFLDKFYEFLPRLILAAIILVVGYLIGKLIQTLVKRFILYLNRGLNQKLSSSLLNVDLGNSAVFISKTIFWILMVITALICLHVLQLEFLSSWFDRIVAYLPNVLIAVVIIFFGIIAGRLLGDLIVSAASRNQISNARYLGNFARYFILIVTIVIALDQLGVDIAFLSNIFIIIFASLLFGASLAFGLGAKTSVSNILGSYYARKNYRMGARVKVGETEGKIVKIADNSVTIETREGVLIVPAKDFNEKNVTILKEETL